MHRLLMAPQLRRIFARARVLRGLFATVEAEASDREGLAVREAVAGACVPMA